MSRIRLNPPRSISSLALWAGLCLVLTLSHSPHAAAESDGTLTHEQMMAAFPEAAALAAPAPVEVVKPVAAVKPHPSPSPAKVPAPTHATPPISRPVAAKANVKQPVQATAPVPAAAPVSAPAPIVVDRNNMAALINALSGLQEKTGTNNAPAGCIDPQPDSSHVQKKAAPVVAQQNAPAPAMAASTSASKASLREVYYPSNGAVKVLSRQNNKTNKYFTHEIPTREDLKNYLDTIPVHQLSGDGAWRSCRKGIVDPSTGASGPSDIPHKGHIYATHHIGKKGPWADVEEKFGTVRGNAVVGNVSTFGGPLDSGVGLGETGALDSKFLRLRGWNWKTEKKGSLTHYSIDRAKPANPDYYCAMRFSYKGKSQAGWASKRLFVYDPVKKTGVVCQPVDWGPSDKETSRIADLSPATLAALGHKDGSASGMEISFADDNAPLGPVENNCSPGLTAQNNPAADQVPRLASN